MKNKKMIAEFMEASEDCYPKGIPSSNEFSGNWEKHIQYFNYDTDWAWLMPVVEKIGVSMRIGTNEKGVSFYAEISDKWGTISSGESNENQITSVFIAIVGFIKQYNANKSKNNA